jgi:hypothetical protein
VWTPMLSFAALAAAIVGAAVNLALRRPAPVAAPA